MGKTKTKRSGEQLDLIDIAPKNAKVIIRAARLYKEAQAVRLTALAEEIKHKRHILELVKKADLSPLKDGKIKFKYDGMTISITPRDELVQVSEEKVKKERA